MDEADRLYALPLEDFTRERNALAKRLGDASIRELKKPALTAWVVNQLTRESELDLKRLLNAGERLEAAQAEAVAGGDRGAFETARREERDAVRLLRERAREVLETAGRPAPEQTLDRVARTLHVGATTEQGRDLLRGGRLTEDLEPTGFDAFAALAATTTARPARPRVDHAKRRRAEREARAARAEADALEREAREAEERVADAERAAATARKRAQRAADRAERLERAAAELAR